MRYKSLQWNRVTQFQSTIGVVLKVGREPASLSVENQMHSSIIAL